MLAWIDVETTGLDPQHDALLEVALVVTDNELAEVARGAVVLPFERGPAFKCDAKVLAMHEANGLWDDCACADAAHVDSGVQEARLLELLRRYVEPKTTPMCGSTIGFDRAFLRAHMPRLEAHFHYRNVDVSTIGELAARWYPEAWAKRPRADGAHRALGDVLGSIELLRYWREHAMLPLAREVAL